MQYCHSCGKPWEEKWSPAFGEECMGCRSSLHVCANCRFYDALASEWCREPMARPEKPRDPKAANRCQWFVFADRGTAGKEAGKSARARAELEKLFNKRPE